MASPMLRISPPSQEEIRQQVAASMPALELYNPSPHWIPQMASARWFYVPPDLDGEIVDHPYLSTFEKRVKVKADGILQVRPLHDKKKNVQIVSAQEIVEVILASRGQMGMCYLPPGDEATRTQLKIQAKETWPRFRLVQANLEMAAWGERLAAFNQNPANKGKFPPVPPQRVLDAMRFMDRHANGGDGGYSFRCMDCGFATSDQGERIEHLRATNHTPPVQAVVDAPEQKAPRASKVKAE